MSEDWLPMHVDPEEERALLSGIPAWMRRPLKTWLFDALHFSQGGPGTGRPRTLHAKIDLVRNFDQRLRQEHLLLSEYFEDRGFDSLESVLNQNPGFYFQFLDYLVYVNSDIEWGDRTKVTDLEEILLDSGSEWKVGTRHGSPGLEKRVPEGVQHAADSVMTTPGHPGQLLSEAWHATFGVAPDFEKAYAKSVKAVEAAAIPIVSPSNASATLGSMISQMRQQGDWKLEMTREHTTHTRAEVLLGMLQMLWTGQNDRHAGQAGYTPSTQAEAEAAVLLAVPLVQWFASGAIQRRP